MNTTLAQSQRHLSIDELLIYEKTKRSEVVAYLLWWFLGVLGVHQFYLGNKKRGFIYLCVWTLFFLCIGLLILSAEEIMYSYSAYSPFGQPTSVSGKLTNIDETWSILKYLGLFTYVFAICVIAVAAMWITDVFSITNKIGVYNTQIVKSIMDQRDTPSSNTNRENPI